MTAENTDTALKPGTEEYNQAMIERARSVGVTADDDPPPAEETGHEIPAMPEGGHEKFYNRETGEYDWASHAREVEYRLSQMSTPTSEPEGQEDSGDGSTRPVDYETVLNEIFNNGTISERTREALRASGMTDEMIDRQVANEQYRMDRETQEVLDYAGGADALNDLFQWAEGALTQAQKDWYNRAIRSDGWREAIDGLKAKRAAADPTANEGRLVAGNAPGSSTIGFRSRAEMKEAMSDPRYGLVPGSRPDPAYRKMVQDRLAVSKFEDDVPLYG